MLRMMYGFCDWESFVYEFVVIDVEWLFIVVEFDVVDAEVVLVWVFGDLMVWWLVKVKWYLYVVFVECWGAGVCGFGGVV